jgi:hypothetical protein
MKNDTLENRMILAHNRSKIPDDKLSMGALKGKYPVILNDGKTIVYISDENKAEETRERYDLLMKSRFPSHLIKYHS